MWTDYCVDAASSTDEQQIITNGVVCTITRRLQIRRRTTDANSSTVAAAAAAAAGGPPRVHAVVQNHKMVLAIEQSLFLLPDEDAPERSVFVSFSATIDALCVSPCGDLVICALTDGNVHGVHIGGVPLFDLCISADDIAAPAAQSRTFVGIDELHGVYYLGCASGRMYKLLNADVKMLGEAAAAAGEMGDDAQQQQQSIADETILTNVTMERCCQLKAPSDAAAVFLVRAAAGRECGALVANGCEILFAGGRLAHWRGNGSGFDRPVRLPGNVGDIKMLFDLQEFIIGLGTNGHLYTVSPYTLLVSGAIAAPVDYLIDDIVVMECNATAIELLLLTRPSTENGQRRILIVDFPAMHVQFELAAPAGQTWLVRQARSSVNLYYLHGSNGGTDPSQSAIDAISMHLVSETQPIERLKKLIQRGCLPEAAAFAEQFQLDASAVHEARVRRLVSELVTNSSGPNSGQLLQAQLDELLALMPHIQDVGVLLSLRHVRIADRSVKRRFLEFLLANVPATAAAVEADFHDLAEQLRRLDTLDLIDPYDCQQQWQAFVRQPHLIETVARTIRTDMPAACLIWQRHSAAILPLADGRRSVQQLLAAIPKATPPHDVILWVRQLVPSIAQCHPDALRPVADWCAERTCALQPLAVWPAVGLEFAASIRAVFAELRFVLPLEEARQVTVMAELDRTLAALRDLCVLHDVYNVRLTLDVYATDSAEQLAGRILAGVALEQLADVARQFLYPRVFQQRAAMVQAVCVYVRQLVHQRQRIGNWQERAVALVEQLADESVRMEYALLVLRNAPVPWSAVVQPLVEYRTSGHPLAPEIGAQFELQALKMLKIRYGWPATEARNDVQKLASKIGRMQRPEQLADIRAVHDLEPNAKVKLLVLHAFLRELLMRRLVDQTVEFLDALDAVQTCSCCGFLLDITAEKLDSAVQQPDDGAALAADMEYLIAIGEYFRCDADTQRRFNDLRRAHTLAVHFEQPVRVADLRDSDKCVASLERGIEQIVTRARRQSRSFASSDDAKAIVRKCWHDTLRLADALALDRVQAVVQISATAQSVHLTCALARWTLELCDATPATAQHWMQLAGLLCAQQCDALHENASGDCGAVESGLLVLPLAYRVLLRAVSVHGDVLRVNRVQAELMAWPRLAFGAYSAEDIEGFLEDTDGLNEAVAARLRLQEEEIANGATVVKAERRRDSFSIFEQVIEKRGGSRRPASCAEAVVLCVANAMKMFATVDTEHVLFGVMRQFSAISEDALESTQNAFVKSLELLIRANQHSAAFAIIQHTLRTQKRINQAVVALSVPFTSHFHRKALRHMLAQKEPDFAEALMILLADEKPTALLQHLEGEMKTGHGMLHYRTLVDWFDATTNHGRSKTHLSSVARATRIKYGFACELSKSAPNVQLDFTSVGALLRNLSDKRLHVGLLRRLSAAFEWDYQAVLCTQMQVLLDQQKLQFDVRPGGSSSGSSEIVIASAVHADIVHLCTPYMDELTSAERFKQILLTYMETMNTYHYEHYLAVIDMLEYMSVLPPEMELWRSVLLFLKHKMTTKRRSRIGQLETDAWLQTQPDAGVMPPIANFRFPFWQIVKWPLRDLLNDELYVDNCEKWFPLIQLHADMTGQIHADEKDHFCMSAVKNSMTQHCALASRAAAATATRPVRGGSTTSEAWLLEPVHQAFLQSVLRLVRHITKPRAKLLVLYFVTNHLPPGVDQIEAAHECYSFAIEHRTELERSGETAHQTVAKICRKYPMLKTQHLLHMYGLSNVHLLELIEHPGDLIEALYGHESIVGGLQTQTPIDIHALAHEIAVLHSLKLLDVQIRILKKWLARQTTSEEEGDVDETFYEELDLTAMGDKDNESGNSGEDVLKIHYILNSWEPSIAVKWLVATIFAQENVDTAHQIKAFEVLIKLGKHIDDSSLFASPTYKALCTQDQYLHLKCTHLLKQLGYNTSAAKLATKEKTGILRFIWSKHASKPLAIEVMAIICHGYGIWTPQIWNGILRQMVVLNMVDNLATLLDVLSAKPALLRLDTLARAWEHCIRAPFRNANRSRSGEQEQKLCAALRLLQACPLADKVDVLELAETCVRLQRPHMAAVMLAFVKDDAGREKIVALVQNAAAATHVKSAAAGLREDIVELEELGIYPMITRAAIAALDLKG